MVVVTASQAIRVAVLPSLARSREEGTARRDGGGIRSRTGHRRRCRSSSSRSSPPTSLADVLTGDGSEVARDACAEALRWVVPAWVAHLFTGLVASTFAALDDYAMPALGYALGSAAGLVYIVTRTDAEGIVAVSRGMAVTALVGLLVPLVVLAWRAQRASMPRAPRVRRASGSTGVSGSSSRRPRSRCRCSSGYLVSMPFAGRLGSGAVTSFGYAYLACATLAGITSFSIGLVSSVPLSRVELTPQAVARHVVASTWVALVVVGAAVGALASSARELVEGVLGPDYGDEVGEEVARLIVVLSAWIVVAVGVNVAFPLAFVTGRLRALPWIGLAALAAQLLLAWVGVELFELDGLAVSLAVVDASRARGRSGAAWCGFGGPTWRRRRGGRDRGVDLRGVPPGRTRHARGRRGGGRPACSTWLSSHWCGRAASPRRGRICARCASRSSATSARSRAGTP